MQTLRDRLGRHVWPVHRLDKGTCGVLLMALNKQAAQALAASFAAHETRKEYRALVRGWLPEIVEVDHPLKPDDAPEECPVQEAHTRLRCLARLSWPSYDGRHPETRISLVEALPTTGRRHQIRRHLKHVAHPIIGDATHGKGPLNRWWAERLGQQRLWLHARALEIAHPVSGQPLRFEADWSTLPQVQEAQGLANAAGPAGLAVHPIKIAESPLYKELTAIFLQLRRLGRGANPLALFVELQAGCGQEIVLRFGSALSSPCSNSTRRSLPILKPQAWA
jgi:tRNA pseudouridine65 synthase